MNKLEACSRKWWFFALLLLAQSVLIPIVSRNFDPKNIQGMVNVTLGNAPQGYLGNLNILFQSLSLVMLVILFVCLLVPFHASGTTGLHSVALLHE